MNWEEIKEKYPNAYNLYTMKISQPKYVGNGYTSVNSKFFNMYRDYKLLACFFSDYGIPYARYWNSNTFTKAFSRLENKITKGK